MGGWWLAFLTAKQSGFHGIQLFAWNKGEVGCRRAHPHPGIKVRPGAAHVTQPGVLAPPPSQTWAELSDMPREEEVGAILAVKGPRRGEPEVTLENPWICFKP